jgi:integrase
MEKRHPGAPKGKSHRGAREGSIYQRKSDGRWVAAITVPGKGQRSLYARTREEARQKLREAVRKQEQGLPVSVKRHMVGEFLDMWLEEAVKPSVRPRTYDSYTQMVRLHIKPTLGHYQLAQLTPQDVQKFLRHKLAAKLSPRTVQYLRAILRIALNQAVQWDMVTRNVAALTKPPRPQRHETRTLNPEQSIALLQGARGDRLEALYVVTLVTGIRQGEVLGLRWSDVDLEAGTITLRKQLQRIDRQYVLTEPKTSNSRRVLPLLPLAVDALRSHRKRQTEERLVAGPAWHNEYELVFTTVAGSPLHWRVVVVRFKALLKHAGLPPVRFHDLRHSCASLLAYLNVHPSVIMAVLGHSTYKLTMDLYTHVDPAALRDAAEKMQVLLGARA